MRIHKTSHVTLTPQLSSSFDKTFSCLPHKVSDCANFDMLNVGIAGMGSAHMRESDEITGTHGQRENCCFKR